MKTFLTILLPTLALAVSAWGAIETDTVTYRENEATLEGVLVYDSAAKEKRPGILVVHQWKGISDYEKKRANMLAEMGYVAFIADIYGKGVRPTDPKEAGATAGKYKGDRPLLRKRVQAGLDWLKKSDKVDASKTAAIGYCFGGTTVLELARSGAEVMGVVSFHGGLSAGSQESIVKSKVLVLHGADDPAVPPKEVADFEEEMRKAKADWQLVAYGGAVHSFTDWNAKDPANKTARYDEKADKRSWEAMKVFFKELFGSAN